MVEKVEVPEHESWNMEHRAIPNVGTRSTLRLSTSAPCDRMRQTTGYIHSRLLFAMKENKSAIGFILICVIFYISAVEAEKRTSRVTSIELPNSDTIYVENPPYGERNDYLERKLLSPRNRGRNLPGSKASPSPAPVDCALEMHAMLGNSVFVSMELIVEKLRIFAIVEGIRWRST